MNKLPMNFDWRTAKQNTSPNIFHRAPAYQQPQQSAGELAESIISHAQLQVLKTSNVESIERFKQCGNNAYKYVVETFVRPMVSAYYNMHKLDSDQILYIAKSIQNMPVEMPVNENGLVMEASIQDGTLYIHPQIVVKAICDCCL